VRSAGAGLIPTPRHGRRRPAIHDFACCRKESRGWPAFAGHDGGRVRTFGPWYYTQAIALKPDYAKAYNNRGWAYHLKGEDANGLPDAERAVALAPKQANHLGTRAEIYEKLGQRDKAIADYRAALALDSHHQSAEDGLQRLGVTP
jgi:hypothetical protein